MSNVITKNLSLAAAVGALGVMLNLGVAVLIILVNNATSPNILPITTAGLLAPTWPLAMFKPIFGNADNGMSDNMPSLMSLLATLMFHALMCSLLTWAVLRWRAKHKLH
ncbi:MAG: hypothetical protein ACR2LC_13370 [Pyrinomonadaceae bacterium]